MGGIKHITKKPRTNIVMALDCSGSMGAYKASAMAAFNSAVKRVQQDTATLNQDATVSLITFADNVTDVFRDMPMNHLQSLTADRYDCSGQTALWDGISRGLNLLETAPEAGEAHVSALLLLITDGGENNSRTNLFEIKRQLQALLATGDYTITAQVPPNSAATIARTLQLPIENVREWESSAKGLATATYVQEQALGTYFTARAMGTKSVTNFFVDTDLSKLDAAKLRKLQNLQTQFKAYPVPAETDIRSFIELKTGRPYAIGDAFYQLTKTEKIAESKQVLLTEKNATAVYGGQEVRELIGLPKGGDAKVVPGNHANFDIFVQSTSTNRKLVRGTKVLVRK